MKTPWHNELNELKFPCRALHDRAFIWPLPAPERFGEEKLIEIPQIYRQYYQNGEGILLSIGPGYWESKGKWNPISDQLKPGIIVLYNKNVPWYTFVEDLEGKKQFVVICGAQDIYGPIGE